jgi:hypothetical protein
VARRGSGVAAALRGLLRGPDFDVVLALAAFAALLIDPLASHQVKELSPLAAGLALVTALPLVLRRRYPLGVLLAIVPLLLVCLAVFHPDHAAAGIVMLVVFTVGLHGHRVRALVVGALMAPVVGTGVLITSTKGDSAATTVAYVALVLGALVAGNAVRGRQDLVRVLAQEEERERAAQARHRFDEQRLRYAHELHDIVGHALVAINVRASAAAHLAAAGCADRSGAGAQVIRLWHAVTGGCGRGRRGERPSAQVRASVQLMLAKRRAASHWDGDGVAEGAGVRSRPRCGAPGRRDQTARAASRVSSRAPMTISPTHRRYPILARRQSRDSRGRRGP